MSGWVRFAKQHFMVVCRTNFFFLLAATSASRQVDPSIAVTTERAAPWLLGFGF